MPNVWIKGDLSSKVIDQTPRHTHGTDCSTWTTKVVYKIPLEDR